MYLWSMVEQQIIPKLTSVKQQWFIISHDSGFFCWCYLYSSKQPFSSGGLVGAGLQGSWDSWTLFSMWSFPLVQASSSGGSHISKRQAPICKYELYKASACHVFADVPIGQSRSPDLGQCHCGRGDHHTRASIPKGIAPEGHECNYTALQGQHCYFEIELFARLYAIILAKCDQSVSVLSQWGIFRWGSFCYPILKW